MTHLPPEQHLQEVTAFFAAQPQVVAVALSGSRTGGWSDERSDLDVYVYVTDEVNVETRRAFITARAARAEVNNTVWETGDEWDDARDGTHLDVMYRWLDYIERERHVLLAQHRARTGYTTAILANVARSEVLHDPTGWLSEQIAALGQPYPEGLRRAIIAENWPLLQDAMGSFTKQLTFAVRRGDVISVNHRLAAYLASYTDILFALNRTYHPGEKRLLRHAATLPLTPVDLEPLVRRVLDAPNAPDMLTSLGALTEALRWLLREQDLLPEA